MSIKSDRWIIDQSQKKGMIHPFAPSQISKLDLPDGKLRRVVSFGVSSYGYDMRLGNIFKVLQADPGKEVDPKMTHAGLYKTVRADDHLVISPHGLVLGQTMEYFKIPRNILTICFGKSTYARCGIFVNVTPFEPEWEGFATLAITNLSSNPVRLYAGEGIAQLIFLQADEICSISYQDKKGKYQAQKEITTAKV
ncbi:MAG: dCTP deaminase [Elusimicrobia bacterium]|nr:dCTP deaminase [Candidatus Obscuribacterium magneticum]